MLYVEMSKMSTINVVCVCTRGCMCVYMCVYVRVMSVCMRLYYMYVCTCVCVCIQYVVCVVCYKKVDINCMMVRSN